ncbi:hypothetical protein NKG05_24580 [Oerskovia sp. M15]
MYVGRLGLSDASGRRLLVDWRSQPAEPYFAATRAHPMGLASRRRYRWTGGWISDYWDESFSADGRDDSAALDDESAFIASLGTSRSPRMRDVLGTIQSDQDAIVRADSRGTLVVDGGPGTGKTVVALHRAAYLLYSDPAWAIGAAGAVRRSPRAVSRLRRGRPAQPRRGACRPAPCATSCPRDLRRGPRPTPRWLASRPPRTWSGRSNPRCGSRSGLPPTAWRSRPRGPTSGSAPTTGQRPSRHRTRAPRTTRRATRSGRLCSRSWSTSTPTRTWTPRRTRSAGRCG